MLTSVGIARVEQRNAAVRDFTSAFGKAGRTGNRRERGGLDSSAVRRLEHLRATTAVAKCRAGEEARLTVYDFLDFFSINQYMPDRKYNANRQAIDNLARDEADLLATSQALHSRFGSNYKFLLQQVKGVNDGIA